MDYILDTNVLITMPTILSFDVKGSRFIVIKEVLRELVKISNESNNNNIVKFIENAANSNLVKINSEIYERESDFIAVTKGLRGVELAIASYAIAEKDNGISVTVVTNSRTLVNALAGIVPVTGSNSLKLKIVKDSKNC